MQLPKALKLLLIIGLPIILLLLALGLQKMGITNRLIILFSQFRGLLKYIVAQAQHETGNFTSTVYLQDHNLFGMKWTNGGRGQIATQGIQSPEGDHYAHYANDSESVIDLLKWMAYTNFPTTVTDVNQYGTELKNRGYFTAGLTSYVGALLNWLS